MARESVKILQGKLDVESLISQLNAALSEEWLGPQDQECAYRSCEHPGCSRP